MSGIGGFVGYGESAHIAAQICNDMEEALKSRGADTHGTYISKEMCLIHTKHNRLAEGRQPVRAVFGLKAYVLVFDGELYNNEELRKELNTLGFRFQDYSDAAVALHGYMAWGQSCVERFNGVFAFAVWDESGLFIARDRLGIRPLYYSVGSYGLVFASTVKAILAHPKIKPIIGEEGIVELIMLGPGRSPGCGTFKTIKELAPGECAYYKSELNTNTYWRLKTKIHQDSLAHTIETVRSLIADAVKRQTSKGGRIASLLSGGLDSSVITTLSRVRDSFSVDYVGNDRFFMSNEFQPEEDREFIEIMASFLRLNHRQVLLGSDELADALTDAMIARGYPGMADVDAALLLLLRRVSENFDIALSGEGADEIFGGYPWYQDEDKLFADTFPWAQNVEYRAKFIKPGLIKSPVDYVQNRFQRAIMSASTLYDDDKTGQRVRQMFNLNLGWFMQTLSSRSDAMSAAVNVSVRMPFLDYRLVEYMYNVPWEYKNHENREKGLMREALKGLLPEKVLERKKSPFPKTHNPGYTRRMQDMLKVLLSDSNAPIFDIVSKKALADLLNENNVNWYGQLMAYPQTIAYFIQVNAWMKEFNVKTES